MIIFTFIHYTSDKKKQESSKVNPIGLNTKNVTVVKDIIKFSKLIKNSIINNPTPNGNNINLFRIQAGPGPFNIYLFNYTKTKLIKKLYSNVSYKVFVSGVIDVLKSVKGGNYTFKATNVNNEQIIGFSEIFTYKNTFQVTIKKKKSMLLRKGVR